MKFLYTYCTHIKGRTPVNRTGNFFDDIKEKFKEVMSISQERNVDAIFHGGDFTDSPVLALNLADEIIDIIEENKKPFYVVRGNHGEIGHNPDLSESSILSHIFRRSSVIQHLDRVQDVWSGGKVFIRGFDFYHNIENDLKENGLLVKDKKEGEKHIAIVHAFISEKPFFKDVAHVVAKDLKTNYDLILLAHYHDEQGIFKVGDTTFIGIGALARKTIGKGDTNRTPNVLFVDTDEKQIEVIPLKNVRPKDEVFNLEIVELFKSNKESLDNFIESLDSVEVQGLGVREAIEKVCEKNNIDKNIKDKIIQKIYEVQGDKEDV